MGEVDTNWNAIYNELLRWQTLLEATTLIKHIPYSYGTSTLYDEQATNQTGQHNQHHTQGEEQDEGIHDNNHQQEHNADAEGVT